MAQIIGGGVSLSGLTDPEYNFTWNVTGTVSASTDTGKAVVQDTAADSSVKLATGGLKVIGVLQSYENRIQEGIKVGTVAHKIVATLPYTGTAPAVGSSVVGSTVTSGSIMATGTLTTGNGTVTSVDTVALTAVVAFGVF